MVTALLIAIGLAIGAASGGITVHAVDAKAAQKREAQHQAREDHLHAEKQKLAGRLATAEAQTTPKSIDATGRVLQAAQAGELADTQLRGALVAAIPQATWADAVIAIGSPQLTATAAEMASCHAANTTGDSGRSGCAKEVPGAWEKAVAALAACPSPPDIE